MLARVLVDRAVEVDHLTVFHTSARRRLRATGAALNGGTADGLTIAPNLWAGIGLVREAPVPHWSAATPRGSAPSAD
ncbi:hypothetical protein [Plantactinospora sp. DSM 117369]